jgi:hypothetical protein
MGETMILEIHLVVNEENTNKLCPPVGVKVDTKGK